MAAVVVDSLERWALDYVAKHRLTVVENEAQPALSSWYESALGRLAYPAGPTPGTETPAEAVRRVVAELGS